QLDLAQHAFAIRERLAPGSVVLASSLRLMGLSLWTLGRPEEAESYYKRGVTLLEQIQPVGSNMSGVLESLGQVALDRGALADAEAYYRRAIDVDAKAGLTTRLAITQTNLGDLLTLRREFDEAERQLTQACGVLEHQLPDSEFHGFCLRMLGDVSIER